jgi:hypothetical protein
MHCPSCGRETPDGPFCEWCGKPLAADHTQPAARIVWAALAIVLYVAVADAAVETFLRESPLRWWITGAAVLYLVLCAAIWRLMPGIWRRMDWASQAVASLVVLLALLGAAAWMSGGLEQGPNLFGQTTATVLAVASALVVALSGALLARLSFIPVPGKIVVGLLAAYGIAAFLWAAHAGTPYASLFHGGSQWTGLPFWLQGATVGGLFLVPLALVLQIAAGTRQMTRAKRPEFALGVIALCLGLVISVAAVRIPADNSIAAAGRPPCDTNASLDTVAPGASGAASMGSALGGLLGSANPTNDAAAKKSTPCTPQGDTTGTARRDADGGNTSAADSPGAPPIAPAQAAIDKLTQLRDTQPQPDMDSIFAAHQGSPAEQFAYVRDQIRIDAYAGAMRGAAGTATTRAGSPTDKALLLAELLRRSGATVRFARATLDTPDVTKLADAARAPPTSIRAGASLTTAQIDRAVASAPEDQRGELRAALVGANDAAQRLYSKADAQGAEIARSLAGAHVALGNDAQLRADAMLALRDHIWVQMQSGADWQDLDPSLPALQPGQRLPTARDVKTSDDLPDDQYVMLEVRAFVTRIAKGSTTDVDVIDASRRVTDMLSQPLTLEIRPDSDVSPKELAKATSFHAHLHIARDDLDGDGFPIDDPDKGSLLALGVVVTVKRPGLGDVSYTRSVVDRRGPTGGVAADWSDTGRVSCSLNSRFNGLVVTGTVTPAYYRTRSLDELIALQTAAATNRKPGSGEGFAGNYPYAALRYFYRAQSLRPPGARFVIDRPNIGFERLSVDCPSGKLSSRMTIDIVENGQAAIAADPAIAARANLTRGALGEAIEMDLAGARAEGIDTLSIIQAAIRNKIPLVVLRPSDSGALKALSLPPMFERAIGSTLASGQVAAATQSPIPLAGSPHVAWWAVDAASGNTIGRVDDGGGQAMLEAAIHQTNATLTIINFMEFGFAVEMCGWTDANLGLNGQDYDVAACITGAVCKLAVQDAMDAGFNMFGMFSELEQTTEAFQLMTSDLEFVKAVNVEGAVCGGE